MQVRTTWHQIFLIQQDDRLALKIAAIRCALIYETALPDKWETYP